MDIKAVQDWMNKSIVDDILILAAVIAIVESAAQNTIKTSDEYIKFLIGAMLYIGVARLLYYTYKRYEISRINVIWSCFSIILAILMGWLLYGEPLGTKKVISAVLAISSIYFAYN